MIKVAVIGVGSMGLLHCRTYTQLPNVKLIAICDKDQSSGRKVAKFFKTKFYTDYKRLLQEESPDAISIAVPTSLHKEVALDCIRDGVNILIEKPLAESVEDATIILEASKAKSIILTVGHIERFNPVVIKLKELIEKGIFGEIVSIVVKRVGLYPPRIKDVNVVKDLAVHDLDIVCYLLNDVPKKIFATGGNGINANRVDYTDILLDFGRTSCYLQVNWLTPIKIRTISITGTLGYAELDYITQELIIYHSRTRFPVPLPERFENFVRKLGKPQKTSVDINKEEPLKLELINFLKAVEKKKKPKVTIEEGLRAVKLSELVLESLKKKKIINYEN